MGIELGTACAVRIEHADSSRGANDAQGLRGAKRER